MEELVEALKEQTAAINALVQSNTQLVGMLIDMAGGEEEQEKPIAYMDGTPCR